MSGRRERASRRVLAGAGTLAVFAITLAGCTTGGSPTASSLPTPVPRPSTPATKTSTTSSATPVPTPPHSACTPAPRTWSDARLAAELLMVVGSFTQAAALRTEAAAGVGGFVFLGEPSQGAAASLRSSLASLVAVASTHGKVVPWMSTDTEGGPVSRLSQVLGPFPSARAMAAEWSPAHVEGVMARRGAAMRSVGITMDLAPVLDTASPTDPVASEAERSFSDTPQDVGRFGIAFAAGLRHAGVVAVGKHFPGLGRASADTDTGPATDPPIASLRADDLVPFEDAVRAGIPAIMVGSPTVPGLTGTVPASVDSSTYRLLRSTLHFKGVAITDALDAGALVAAGFSGPEAAVAAIRSGADMAMVNATEWRAALGQIRAAIAGGAIPVSDVQASVMRILDAKHLAVCGVP